MKSAIDYLNEWFPNIKVIVKDRGNRGYYILYDEDSYDYISKKHIIQCLTRYSTNDRFDKLVTIKIMNE